MKRIRVTVALMAMALIFGAVKSAHAANVVETAASHGSFKTLVAAVKAAGLADALATTSPITVFAPTDEAFAKLPKKTLRDLLKPENKDKLRAILTYHVVPSRILAKDVPHDPTLVKTLNGSNIRAVRRGKSVRINNARVVTANIKTDNGIIHVVNTVLIPGKLH